MSGKELQKEDRHQLTQTLRIIFRDLKRKYENEVYLIAEYIIRMLE